MNDDVGMPGSMSSIRVLYNHEFKLSTRSLPDVYAIGNIQLDGAEAVTLNVYALYAMLAHNHTHQLSRQNGTERGSEAL